MPVLLDEQVLEQQGCYRKVRRWYLGWNPELNGVYIIGIQGRETVVTVDSIRPTVTFTVAERMEEAA